MTIPVEGEDNNGFNRRMKRSAMQPPVAKKTQTLLILGGSGFVGYHLLSELTKAGHKARVIARRPERCREVLVFPGIQIIDGQAQDNALLKQAMSGVDAVINLVGVLHNDHQAFRRLHVELPAQINAAAYATGVRRILHMSAINAHAEKGPSHYLRSKGSGEDNAHAGAAVGLQVTSFRPSVIFGPGDNFYNRFARLHRFFPVLPLAMPHAAFAPIYVGDVARAMLATLDDKTSYGQRYDLCGPRTYTLQQIAAYTGMLIGKPRPIIPLGPALSRLQARIMGCLPGKPFTYDNYLSLKLDAVCRGPRPPCLTELTPVEAVVPQYLAAADIKGRYDQFRQFAGR